MTDQAVTEARILIRIAAAYLALALRHPGDTDAVACAAQAVKWAGAALGEAG